LVCDALPPSLFGQGELRFLGFIHFLWWTKASLFWSFPFSVFDCWSLDIFPPSGSILQPSLPLLFQLMLAFVFFIIMLAVSFSFCLNGFSGLAFIYCVWVDRVPFDFFRLTDSTVDDLLCLVFFPFLLLHFIWFGHRFMLCYTFLILSYAVAPVVFYLHVFSSCFAEHYVCCLLRCLMIGIFFSWCFCCKGRFSSCLMVCGFATIDVIDPFPSSPLLGYGCVNASMLRGLWQCAAIF